MPGNRLSRGAVIVMLIAAATVLVLPAAAQTETPPGPPTEVTTEVPTATRTAIPTGTVTEAPTEVPTETVTETATGTLEEMTTSEEQASEQVFPGDTIQVEEESRFYDFSALRNETASGEPGPVTELRSYESDEIENGTVAHTVNLGQDDTRAELAASDFAGFYGTYYPYDGESVIDQPITVEGPTGGEIAVNTTETTPATEATTGTPAATETIPEETTPEETSTLEMRTFTPIMTEAVASPTQAPLSPVTVTAALAMAGLLVAATVRRR
jgi:hypothetical protein